MKKLLKTLGNIPTGYMGLAIIVANVFATGVNNIPLIIGVNIVLVSATLLGIFGRKFK